MTIKEKERQRVAFVNGVVAVAAAHGVSKGRLKNECFGSYATGNRRLEHHQEEITLVELFNIAAICRIPPRELICSAAANMK